MVGTKSRFNHANTSLFAVTALRQYNSNVSPVRRHMVTELRIIPITGIGEIPPGSDLGLLIYEAIQAQQLTLLQGDILVVTQKIISKAEGSIVNLDEKQPSE